MKVAYLAMGLLAALSCRAHGQDSAKSTAMAATLKTLATQVTAQVDREALRGMLGRHDREQIEAANRRSSADWAKIKSRVEWETFRREKTQALRQSLGPLPPRSGPLRSLVTGRVQGEGFEIQNVVFESQPGLVVTANLYVPSPPRASMPGLVISHSHHNPKEQGELQDMGMTWARAGCYVLVPDHLGHGERRQHPFVTAADYPAAFQPGRQDYYFRYDTSLQLYLAGESLMGWMVHDLMTGIDLLLTQPGIDPARIVMLGSVAGGGDPAGVTAALDDRIACVCPFNFGGPQPETRYPLPEDAETWFNYAGGGSWESTRNLHRSAGDGFLPWVIVGSVAPRRVIHAHEFAWDGERDPVWRRYRAIWDFYGAADRLAVAHGQGTLTGQDPPGSHCNNIGVVHRRQIHKALGRWFGIGVQPQDEYSRRRSASELLCLTAEARERFQPQLVHQLLAEQNKGRLSAVGDVESPPPSQDRKERVREHWQRVLGRASVLPPDSAALGDSRRKQADSLTVRFEMLETAPGILVPVLQLQNDVGRDKGGAKKLLLAVAQDGIAGLLERRGAEIANGLLSGWQVVIAEVRGTGLSALGTDFGPQSAMTRHSATALMWGESLLGSQLRDLNAVWRHVRPPDRGPGLQVAVLGDSGFEPMKPGAGFSHPHRVASRPRECQPNAPLLALLFALTHDEATSVECHGGLVSFQTVVESPFVQVSHAAIVPGVLRRRDDAPGGCDLPDLAAALAPRPLRLANLVDGRGNGVESDAAKTAYATALKAYADAGAAENLRFSANNN